MWTWHKSISTDTQMIYNQLNFQEYSKRTARRYCMSPAELGLVSWLEMGLLDEMLVESTRRVRYSRTKILEIMDPSPTVSK